MASFRFVHAADLHLDTPFDGLSRLGAEVPEVLRDASLQAWDNLVALTLERQADFLVLAGDIYDGPQRGLRAQLRFLHGLRRLSEAGVQVFMVHGNHDPLEEGWSAVRDWPAGVTRFGPDEVAGVPVERDGRRLATVYGISYRTRETWENLALRFPARTEPGFAVGVLHCNLGGQRDHAAYSPCQLADLQASDIDYWALGHIHRREVVSGERPCVVYPGSLQGRSPKPSETGAKGAVVVEVADDRVQDLSFVPLDVVRFDSRELDIGGAADLAALRDALSGLAEDAADAADGRRVILRAVLTGRGGVHRELRRDAGVLEQLLRDLQEGQGANSRVWWDKLSDRSGAPLDRDAIRQRRGEFSSELLAYAERLAADPEGLAAVLDAHVRPRDTRLRGLITDGEDDDGALLDAAIELALDRLEPDAES